MIITFTDETAPEDPVQILRKAFLKPLIVRVLQLMEALPGEDE